MNYLEDEIDEAISSLKIRSEKLDSGELVSLIGLLTKKFFKSESNVLDPVDLNEKSTEHNPKFWQEIHQRIHQKHLLFFCL